MAMLERLGNYVPPFLIFSWLALTLWAAQDPTLMQRIGAYGVAAGIVALSLARHNAISKISPHKDQIDVSLFNMQRDINEMYFSIIEKLGNGQGLTEDELEQVRKAKNISMSQEIYRQADGYEVQISMAYFRIEVATIVLATLQTGFGDFLVNLNKCGATSC